MNFKINSIYRPSRLTIATLAICCCWSLFISCSKESSQQHFNQEEANNGRYYGGVLRVNESSEIKGLYPPSIIDAHAERTANQIFDRLFKLNEDGNGLTKVLVDHYSIDSTGTLYRFVLKPNIYFHDDGCFPNGKGRELTASDVAFVIKQLGTYNRNNHNSAFVRNSIEGGKSYYNSSRLNQKADLTGVKVINKYTLEIILTKPRFDFLETLAMACFGVYPKEAMDLYGSGLGFKAIGTGPFQLKQSSAGISIDLARNNNYHLKDQFGNQLPFLDAVNIRFIKSKETELREFSKGILDVVYDYDGEMQNELPDKVEKPYYKELIQSNQTVSISMLNYKNFYDKNVAKSIEYGLGRNVYTMNEYSGLRSEQLTPRLEKIRFSDSNLDSARFFLSISNYRPGSIIDLYTDNKNALEIAKSLAAQLHKIGIKTAIIELPISEILGMKIKKFSLLISTETFPSSTKHGYLLKYHSDYYPYPNICGYSNDRYDRLFENMSVESDVEKRDSLVSEIEKILIQEPSITSFQQKATYRLKQFYVGNIRNKNSQNLDFSTIYLLRAKKIGY